MDPKQIVADGYDQMGHEFDAWNSERPREVRRWFLGEVLARLGEGSTVLELGCGPGTDTGELSSGRRYVGVDLSRVQLSIARQRVLVSRRGGAGSSRKAKKRRGAPSRAGVT